MLGNHRLVLLTSATATVVLAVVASRVAADIHSATYLGTQMCLACHLPIDTKKSMEAYKASLHAQAKPDPGAKGADLYRKVTALKNDGTYAEVGVGCERCHAPGSDHLKDVNDKTQKLIINPAGLPEGKPAMVCGQCHATGKTKSGVDYPKGFLAGDDLSAVLVLDAKATGKFARYNEWSTSLHAQKNTVCTSCHDPHGGAPKMLKAEGDAVCLTCHLEDGKGTGLPCKTAANDRGGKLCKDCHMPSSSHEFKKPEAK